MGLDLSVIQLPEPELEFAGRATYADPKEGLAAAGPFSLRYQAGQPEAVRLGIVGPADTVERARAWFQRCQGRLFAEKQNRRRFPDFPGFRDVFRSELVLDDRWVHELPPLELATALKDPDLPRFREVLEMYLDGVAVLSRREMGPNVILCAVSDEIYRACATVSLQEARARQRRRADPNQLSLALDFAENVPPEELVYRSFRRALKARAMLLDPRVPTQIVTSHLFEDGLDRDDPATRAWSVSVGLYFKAKGIPWRLARITPHVCFVGLSFHRRRTTTDETTYASLAQAFSTDIEGFVLRGARVPRREDRQLYLTRDQAEALGRRILDEYRERASRTPLRITMHKTTRFHIEEREGFARAFADVPLVELLTLSPSAVRLLTNLDYPPARGTVCTINHETHLLYTTGLYRPWGTYPGPHVPAPLRILLEQAPTEDLRRICEETLGLTKMNWNDARVGGRDPITLHMAREVGPIMAEIDEADSPETSYRYYM